MLSDLTTFFPPCPMALWQVSFSCLSGGCFPPHFMLTDTSAFLCPLAGAGTWQPEARSLPPPEPIRVRPTQAPPQFGSRGWWSPLSGLDGARARTFVPASRTTPSDHILLACTHFRRRFGANDDAVAFGGLRVSDFGGGTGGRGWKVKSAMSAIEGRGRG